MSGPFSPQQVGDLLVLAVKNDTWPQSVSSVSGGGVSSWAPAGAPFYDGADGQIEQIWYGTVSSTGSSTLSVDWGTTIGNVAVVLQEFSAGTGATWALDTEGSSSSPFPSLSAAHGSELYFGLGFAWGNAGAGSTPGVTYQVHDPNAPASPPATASNPGFELKLYDAGDRLTSSTDATGATTRYTYGPDGQVLTTTGPAGQVSTNCYYWQTSGCASSARPGGGAGSALYSTTTPPAAGEPGGVTTTYTYYPGGAAATTTTPAGTTTQSYNPDGTLASSSRSAPVPGYSATAAVSYTYGPAGLVASRTDGTGTTSYTYDLAGDKTSTPRPAAPWWAGRLTTPMSAPASWPP